jgi:hypothetical protein
VDSVQGVTPGDSPTGTEDVQAVSSTANPEAVNADSAPVADRTQEQMFREMQRKWDETHRTQQQILTYLSALNVQQPVTPAPQATPSKDLTDEQLWELAKTGDRAAFEVYQSRIAERTYESKQTVQNRTGIVDRQLAALKTRYPVLADGAHELTQAVNAAYALYVQNGYPKTKETLLQAATVAIADNPEMVSALHGAPAQSRETSRRTAVNAAQSGTTGVSHRNAPATGAPQGKLTPEEDRLARAMNVKDPQGAKKRFLERNAQGRSAISPTVAAALGEIPENF